MQDRKSHQARPPALLRVLGLGVAALATGLVVPVMTWAGHPVSDSTSLHIVVACVMPVLVGTTFWSAARTFTSSATSR
ncbi:hypothetical protein ACNKF0_11935 [Nocardioides sp. T5]|uniref:hypothetical protein n=1 Tax=Nocardioides sp. T5 TaxID=3400182 RepID=UPI003A84A970